MVSGSFPRPCHFPAGLGATATHLGAFLHLSVVPELFTVTRALLANLGTDPAGPCVKSRAPQHVIGAGLADLCAVKHQPNVIDSGMPASLAEAIGHCLNANLMTVCAVLDAVLHAVLVGHFA
jgi:hypothetical protein